MEQAGPENSCNAMTVETGRRRWWGHRTREQLQCNGDGQTAMVGSEQLQCNDGGDGQTAMVGTPNQRTVAMQWRRADGDGGE
jgi:hypothetical protein